jgi:hypothetical protein
MRNSPTHSHQVEVDKQMSPAMTDGDGENE